MASVSSHDTADLSKEFRLNPALDWPGLAEAFARDQRIQIPDLLVEEDAVRLNAELRSRQDWVQVVNSGGKVFDLDRPTRSGMSQEQLSRLDEAVFAGAREGFQHRYESLRVPDDVSARRTAGDLVSRFASWLSSGEVRDRLRQLTGAADIAFADAQATAFSPGDFLTAHDDDVAGKNRRAAYVYNLSAPWRAEWGGLLLFHDARGDIEQGFTPRFNSLNIFAVPQLHSVSMVTRSAPSRRYSITGWLRAR